MTRPPPISPLFPPPTLFRSPRQLHRVRRQPPLARIARRRRGVVPAANGGPVRDIHPADQLPGRVELGPLELLERSEEHTSELQSRQYLVCRLLLEKKKNNTM